MGKCGRGAEGKSLVLVAAQEDGDRIGRIRLCRVPNASQDSLERAIGKAIEAGSRIRTDDWSFYQRLKILGYKHEVVRRYNEGEVHSPAKRLQNRWRLLC